MVERLCPVVGTFTVATEEFRLALVQLAVGACKADNLTRASRLIGEAAKEGAQVVVLPECCNSPYGNDYFPEYAESIPGDSTKIFAQAAKDNNVHLVAGTIPERSKGTIPERDGDKIYNTCTVFNPNGSLVAKYRKLHLFDIDVPGKITFQESKTLTAGDNFATVDLGFCNIGIGICYDIRFPEVAKIYADKGCQLLLYPGAFNMTTGPAHWELLQRGRAIDNQLFVAAVSPARDESAKYHAWGHSTVVDPWGTVIATTEHEETIVYADIDLDYMKQVREQIPTSKQKRNDMYTQVKLANM